MKWLFVFAVAIATLMPSDFAHAQQSGKERDKQRPGQQGGRDAKERTQGGKAEGRGGQGGGGLFRLLDADRDGKLSANEINGAVAMLMKLDKNRDGVLDSGELASASRGQGGGQRGNGVSRNNQRKETQAGNNQ
ncbi:MAG: hypothetical protein NXI32_23395 [bacterium]|nr:hypothetical protein [bacterium]